MAENIDLNINIGANVTDLQAQLQKSENLLKQFEAALKKATNVGEINYLNNQIKNLNTSIAGINTQMNKVGRPTADATTALSNLSRVAQDAPYGFIGIANNLNPLLESFQRLSKESGSSTQALKSMVAGLTGPAGIGLALGVVSSLAVTYSKEIANFFKGPEAELKKFREELNKVNEDINKIVGGAMANQAVALNLTSVIVGGDEKEAKNALKILQELYSKSAELKKAKIGQDQQYYINLVNLAANQEKAIGREKLNEQELNLLYTKREEILKRRNAELKKAEELQGIPGFPKAARVSAEKMRIGLSYGPQLEQLDADIVKARIKNIDLVRALSEFEVPETLKGAPKTSPIVNYAREENKALTMELEKMKALREKMKSIGLEPLKLFELPSEERAKEDKRKGYFEKQAKDLLEESKKGGFGKYMEGLFKKDKNKLDEEEGEKKRLEDLTKSYARFAETISGTVTSALFGMYDAMQEGASATQALGDMFTRLLRQMAEMVIQAAIFAGIMSIISGGASAKGGLSFIGAFKGILGLPKLAEGGIATGATLAMVGEGSESEAILPLSKLGGMLNRTFSAGSMSAGANGGGTNQFVLRGQDLLLSVNRAQKASNLKGQNISLA